MSTKTQNVIRFEMSPDDLLQILLNPDFQIAREKAMGSLEARVVEKSRTDDRVQFEVHTKDYARGMTGIDRTKTEDNRVDYDWNTRVKKASWSYHGASNKMAKVWGGIQIEADGDGARLTNFFEVQVKVPLMGGKIEKMVLKEVDKSWPKYEKAIRTFAEQKD